MYKELTPKAKTAASLYQSTGFYRTTMNYFLTKCFHIPAQLQGIEEQLDIFFMHKWQGSHLKTQLANGTITRAGTTYLASFIKCTFLEATSAEQVLISFRAAKPEFNLPAYALIKIAKKEELKL